MHKNNLGQVAACSGLLSTWLVLKNWARHKLSLDLVLLVLTLWLLRGSESSHSSTAILGFLVGASVLVILQLGQGSALRTRRLLIGLALAILFLAPLAYMLFSALDTAPTGVVLQATGRDATLSDRTFLWKDLFENAAKHPFLGVGFGAFWVGPMGYELYPFPNWAQVTHTWRPGEGHNGLLDVYVDLGAVGLTLVLIVIGSALRSCFRELPRRFEFGRFRLALLLAILTNNLAESSLLNGTHSLWFLFLLVAVSTPLPDNRHEFHQAKRLVLQQS